MLIHSAIDVIPGPSSLLACMGGGRGLVRQNGGLVIVVSAYNWNEDMTPRGSWLGGFIEDNGKKVGNTLENNHQTDCKTCPISYLHEATNHHSIRAGISTSHTLSPLRTIDAFRCPQLKALRELWARTSSWCKRIYYRVCSRSVIGRSSTAPLRHQCGAGTRETRLFPTLLPVQ